MIQLIQAVNTNKKGQMETGIDLEKLKEEELVELHDQFSMQEFFKGLTLEEKEEYERVKDILWKNFRL